MSGNDDKKQVCNQDCGISSKKFAQVAACLEGLKVSVSSLKEKNDERYTGLRDISKERYDGLFTKIENTIKVLQSQLNKLSCSQHGELLTTLAVRLESIEAKVTEGRLQDAACRKNGTDIEGIKLGIDHLKKELKMLIDKNKESIDSLKNHNSDKNKTFIGIISSMIGIVGAAFLLYHFGIK